MVNQAEKKQTINKSTRNLSFRFIILIAFLVMFYSGYKLLHQTYKYNQINVEITQLQSEIERLNQDNQNLTELINYLQTDNFKEKEAREKLNLIKEGEHLVLVKEKDSPTNSQLPEQQKMAQVVVERPNYYWWWHYYFSL